MMKRLSDQGLVENTGGGDSQVAPNEWRLTPMGQRVD
jgi:hypothetical protein